MRNISLFFFANCPLPFENDPTLDTAVALDYCRTLQKILWEVKEKDLSLDDNSSNEFTLRAVSRITTCLTERVEIVRQSYKDLKSDEPHTFYGTPFSIREVLEVLNDFGKSRWVVL